MDRYRYDRVTGMSKDALGEWVKYEDAATQQEAACPYCEKKKADGWSWCPHCFQDVKDKEQEQPKCNICGDTGELREAVQAWDVSGAPIPKCEHCDGTGKEE